MYICGGKEGLGPSVPPGIFPWHFGPGEGNRIELEKGAVTPGAGGGAKGVGELEPLLLALAAPWPAGLSLIPEGGSLSRVARRGEWGAGIGNAWRPLGRLGRRNGIIWLVPPSLPPPASAQ